MRVISLFGFQVLANCFHRAAWQRRLYCTLTFRRNSAAAHNSTGSPDSTQQVQAANELSLIRPKFQLPFQSLGLAHIVYLFIAFLAFLFISVAGVQSAEARFNFAGSSNTFPVFQEVETQKAKSTNSIRSQHSATRQNTASSNEGREDTGKVEGKKLLAPKSFGFDFSPAFVEQGTGETVWVRDEAGERVTGELYCRGGDKFAVVLMPDGQLKSFRWDDTQLASVRFKPMRHLDIGRKIQEGYGGIFRDFKIKKTRHYVYVYNTTPKFFEGTKRILESMHSGLIKRLERDGFEIKKSKVPLVVIMFANEQQFQSFREMPAGVVAYYNMVSNHIVLYEPSLRRGARADLIQDQALSTIAHEGVHQILHNVGIQKRLSMWPMWLSEGLAEYYAPTSTRRGFRWKGPGEINDLRMFELENYLQSRELQGLDGSTIKDIVGAARLDSTGYATAWAIVHFLATERRSELVKYIKYVSHLGALEGMASRGAVIPENVQHFEKFFNDDFREAESNLITHMKSLSYDSPVGHLPHFVTTLTYSVDGKATKRGCIYHRRSLAEAWQKMLLSTLDEAERESAQFHFKDFANRSQAARFLANFLK